ncbi:MAG: WG repeat-containing protein, partial [Oscillospiraceae bacterium]|nr:WG repeat-containing protein [Oscillospiraceae bacterium]
EESAPPDSASRPESQENEPAPESGINWLLAPSVLADDIQPMSSYSPFSCFAYAPVNRIEQGGQCGLIDYDGNIVLDIQYAHIDECLCGIITADRYELDENYQITGEHGGHGGSLYDFVWDVATDSLFAEQYAPDFIFPVRAAEVSENPETMYGYDVDYMDVYGFAENEKTLVIPFQFDRALGFWCDRAAVRKDGKWGYIDTKGNLIIPFEYDAVHNSVLKSGSEHDLYTQEIYDFTGDYVAVKKQGQYGLLDVNGGIVIPFEYEAIRPVYNGMAWIKDKGQWGVADIGA